MEARGLFAPDIYAIPRQNVFFESSRPEKLARIAALHCTCFIDDLEEVLIDPGFPPGVKRVLFGTRAASPHFAACPSWQGIAQAVFDD
jgi:hypothetical protein